MKRIFFFILFLGVLASFGNEGWVKLYKLRQHEASLEGENRLMAQRNLELQFEIENLKESKYLDHYIRRELGFIRDHEIIYEFINK